MSEKISRDEVRKKLGEAWTRFASRIAGVRGTALELKRELETRRRKKRLADAWTRFLAKISRIRAAALALMREMEERRRAKALEEARRRLQNL